MLSPCFRSLAEADVQQVITFLQDKSNNGLLPFSVQNEAAERYSLSLAEIEEISLTHGILPARYQRNQEMISTGSSWPFSEVKLRSSVAGAWRVHN